MTTRTDRSSSIEEAATELGLSPAALELHMADRGIESVSPNLFQSVQNELKARVNSLRLDDLGKIALTVDWLTEHALGVNEPVQVMKAEVEALRLSLEAERRTETVEALATRLAELEGQIGASSGESESAKSALQVAAGMQSLIESQGREIDSLRGELAANQREIAQLTKTLHGFMAALRGALSEDPPTGHPGKDRAPEGEATTVRSGQNAMATHPEPAPAAAPASESITPHPDASDKAEPGSVEPASTQEPETDPRGAAIPGAHPSNKAVVTPVRFGIRREIEYNFLLERMGFRRLDSYTNDELADGRAIVVPNDAEIRAFLATYELGGIADEVEILTVHRGDFQMVQFQRVEKQGGLRGWMPKQRK
jgi:hypothetical protein